MILKLKAHRFALAIARLPYFVSLGNTNTTTLLLFSHSVMSDSATPWTAAHQASLSIISRSLLKLMSIESMMQSNHLILCLPFSSCPQSFPASGSFQMSQPFASGGQSTRVSVSVLPMNTQDRLISLLSKGLSRVFSSTTI